MENLEQHLEREISDIRGKSVRVMSGRKILHKGIVLGNTISGIQIGVTWTSLKGFAKESGRKYISVFYTRRQNLVLDN